MGFLGAAVEILVRATYPGGLEPKDLLPVALLALGTYAAAGGALGTLWGLALTLFPPSLPGPRALNSALLTLATGLAAIAGFSLADRPLSLRSPTTLLPGLGLAAASFLLVWLARAWLGRLLSPLLHSRVIAPALGFLVGIALACSIPWLLLMEPLSAVRGWWIRAGSLLAGLSAGGLAFVSLLLASAGARGTVRHLQRAVVAYFGAVLVLSLGFGFLPLSDRAVGTRPNLLLIVIDTLRADHLSAYGYARDTSPNISALADRGTLFLDAVSAASFTMPSMASLLTSRLPYEHRVRQHPSRLAQGELTLAEVLRRAGYVTGGVVRNPLLIRKWGFDQGFGFYDAIQSSLLYGAEHPLFLLEVFERFRRASRNAEGTTESAVRWLRRHRKDPFFLWVHFFDPHFPYNPPPPYDDVFSPRPATAYEKLPRGYRSGELKPDDVGVGAVTRDELFEGVVQYDGEIAYVDRHVGRLLDTLNQFGMSERTLVVLTSDHGEAFGEHGVTFEHGFNTYEELMHVPLLIAWPLRVAPGRRVQTQVSLIDVAPTVLDLLGSPIPPSMRGRSLVPLLVAAAAEWEAQPAYGENHPLLPGHPSYSNMAKYGGIHSPGTEGQWRMIRLAPWKLIHIPGRPDGENLLFHLGLDPTEEHDRVASQPEELRILLAHLESILREDQDRDAVRVELTADDVERLRALGYAE